MTSIRPAAQAASSKASESAKAWLLTGAILGGLAVAAGAFGAHALKTRFLADGALTEADQQQLGNWETAARYQMYHALALLAVGLLSNRTGSRLRSLSGGAFLLGTLVFSGCLYALVLSGERWLGRVVPLGGMLLIVGWICLATAVWSKPEEKPVTF